MKKVSYKIAKAIKDAGYPQPDKNSGLTEVYALEDHDDNFVPYTRIGKLTTNYHCQTFRMLRDIPFVVAPTYLDVWLWLWQEKKIKICVEHKVSVDGNDRNTDVYILAPFYALPHSMIKLYNNPEDALIDAIEYLVENGLIK